MSSARYLTADEAAGALGISKGTLYAYVSRGLIRSEATAGSRRTKKYHAEDVRRLERKQALRRDPSAAARSALDFGLPVMESALTLIEDGRLFYRGRDACRLAQTHSLQEVAALLWLGALDAPLPEESPLPVREGEPRASLRNAPVERFQAMLPGAAMRDEQAFHFSKRAAARTGVRLLHLAQHALAPFVSSRQRLDVARAFRPRSGDEASERLVRAALVLCADHELNVSAFAARCAASAGASLYGVVGAGLATVQGHRHGGHTQHVDALLDEAGTPGALRQTVAARLRRGDAVPGFGHRLYPAGDPRAALLTQMLRDAHPHAAGTAFAEAAAEVGPDLLGAAPTVDFALVALCRTLELPATTALALFAAGRTVGWIGHAIEQYEDGRLIRPRATYTGPRPAADD